MKSATYYTDTNPKVQPLFVLKAHADGRVDLGTKEKVLVIGKCPVSEEPKVGHCVLVPEAKPTPPAPPSAPPAPPAPPPAS